MGTVLGPRVWRMRLGAPSGMANGHRVPLLVVGAIEDHLPLGSRWPNEAVSQLQGTGRRSSSQAGARGECICSAWPLEGICATSTTG